MLCLQARTNQSESGPTGVKMSNSHQCDGLEMCSDSNACFMRSCNKHHVIFSDKPILARTNNENATFGKSGRLGSCSTSSAL